MDDKEEKLEQDEKLARHLDQSNNPVPTKGFRLSMPVGPSPCSSRQERQRMYWRSGIRRDVYEWLVDHVGPTGNYLQWDQEDPEVHWLYTGVNQPTSEQSFKHNIAGIVQLRFRDPRKAMLFKLAWWDKL